ncbi:MAG: hypothetical protein ILM98_07655 [Kiritimatiellae bacterium]|nr:hypothetical protein [Kiritimatiellia bacterium]
MRVAGFIYTAAVFLAGWVLFRSEGIKSAWTMFASLVGAVEPARQTMLLYVDAAPKLWIAMALGLLFAYPVVPRIRAALARRFGADSALEELISWLAVTVGAALALLFLAGGSYNPFIYFRF